MTFAKGFSQETREAVYNAQNGYSAEIGSVEKIHSIHHKLPNTAPNRKRFPLFIHSPFNAVGLSENTHKNKPHLFTITLKEAQMYEDFLTELKGSKEE